MSQNTFCWVDLPVLSLERATAFYSAILDTSIEKIEMGPFVFALLPHENDNVSGCLTVMEDRKPSQDGPLVYLNVEGRLDKALVSVSEAGGKVLQPKEQMGPYGHRAIILDTEGNRIALYSKEA